MKTIGEARRLFCWCSESQIHSRVQDVGVQCSLMALVRHSTSVVLPYASSTLPSDASQSESEMSQGDFETPDLDTSAYTIQNDSSSSDPSAPSVVTPTHAILCLSQHSLFYSPFVDSVPASPWTSRK